MRRQARWTPVLVSDRDRLAEIERRQPPDNGIAELALSDMSLACSPRSVGMALETSDPRKADLHFGIGVAIALALPAFIGLGLYLAASLVLVADRTLLIG
jgi:hypothetical protein